MKRGKLIASDFEEGTMEFRMDGDFTANTGKYVIMTEKEFEDMAKEINTMKCPNCNGEDVSSISTATYKYGCCNEKFIMP